MKTDKIYMVGNRGFTAFEDAEEWCVACDIDPSIIEIDHDYIKGENGYSLDQINDCIKLVQGFNRTVTRKAFHTPKYWELVKLVEDHLQDVNQWLFRRDNYGMTEYKKAIDYGLTKKEIDKKLRYALLELGRQLVAIKNECF